MAIVLGMIIGYIVLTNILGIVVGRKVSSSSTFLVGGGKFGWVLIAAFLCGAWEGSGSSIGITQQAFNKGIYPGFYSAFFSFGLIIAAFFMVPLARRLGVLSLPQLVGNLFGPSGRYVTAVLWTLQDLIILSMQYVGAAGIFSAIFGIPVHWGVLIALASVAVYMVMGGLVASAWTNIMHVITLTIAAIVAVPLALSYGGGFGEVVATLPQKYFNVSGMGMQNMLGWYLAVAAGPIIHQITFQMSASAKSEREAKKGFVASAAIVLLFATPFAILGVVAKKYIPGTTDLLAMADLAMSISPWFAGLLLSGVLAAIISTMAPMAVTGPTIFVNDLYKPLRPEAKDKELLLVSRICAVAYLLVGLVVALFVKEIVAATVFAFTFRLVVLCNVVIPLALASYKLVTAEGGVLGIIFGGAAPVISQFIVHSKVPGMYWAVLGAVVGLIIGSVITRYRGHYVKRVWSYMKAHAMEKTVQELSN